MIPTRDRLSLCRTALRSALAQVDVEVEAIVVDDGSVDGTASWLGKIADRRVRVVRHELPLGVSAARNAAVATARAPWIAFLDDDDVWAPEKLGRQLDVQRRTGAAWSYTGFVVFGEHERVSRHDATSAGPQLFDELLSGNRVGPPSLVVVSADTLRTVGGFDRQLAVMADWDLWIRLAEHHAPAVVPEPLLGYRGHAGNMQKNLVASIPAEWAYMRRKHAVVLEERGAGLDGASFWSWRASLDGTRASQARAIRGHLQAAWRQRAPVLALNAIRMMTAGGLRKAVPRRRHDPGPDWLNAQLAGEKADAAGKTRAPALAN